MATKRAKAKSKPRPKAMKAKPRPGARRQPETLRLRTLSPFLTTSDLQRSIAFYRDVLGFVVGEEWRENGELGGCEIHAGAITFMLNQDDFAKGRDRQKGIGHRLWCHTAQDLDRLAAEIKARGGKLDEERQDLPWGDRVGEEWRENGELGGCEIHAGAITFMLNQDDFAKGRDRQKGIGHRLWCHTAQDLDRLAAEIKARGGNLDQEPQDMPWGDRVFMITDPDGFKLTFVQAR